LHLPAGTFDAYLLELDHKIDLPLTNVRVRIACGMTPEKDLIYRRMQWNVRKLLVFEKTRSRAFGLAEPEAEEGEPSMNGAILTPRRK